MKMLLAVTATAALVAAAASVQPAHGASSSTWYWSPGACKSELQTYGVAVGDGRTFNVQRAFCVGLHNHCWLNSGLRRYKVFIAVMHSYDGVVRRMQLTVTGKKTWTGAKLQIIERYMSGTAFVAGYGNAAWSVASLENKGGCYDIHP